MHVGMYQYSRDSWIASWIDSQIADQQQQQHEKVTATVL